MFEKHEKWFVLAIIALAIWYFYKKGKARMTTVAASMPASIVDDTPRAQPYDPVFENLPSPARSLIRLPNEGSIVNTANEPYRILPAQTTSPVFFKPAQPSTVPISMRVSAGPFTWYPAPPTLRSAPADIVPKFV